MNRGNFDFLYKMFPHHNVNDLDIIIVNQTTKDRLLVSELPTVKVINSLEKGLSKSRNLALDNATANWCLIADDDLVYVKDFEKIVCEGITHYSKSGVIVFQAQLNDIALLRSYPKMSKQNLSEQEIFHVASFEMLVNRCLVQKKVGFHTAFGLGSGIFNCGEEQVFMNTIKKHLKLSISFYQKTIVTHPQNHTGNNYQLKDRYFTKGGVYAKIFPKTYKKWICMQLFFDVKQGHLQLLQIVTRFKEALRGVQKLKAMENGKN